MRAKLRIDTFNAAKDFANKCRNLEGNIIVKDPNGLCVNGKSILGMLHALEFTELWVESDIDHWIDLREFIIEEPDKKKIDF